MLRAALVTSRPLSTTSLYNFQDVERAMNGLHASSFSFQWISPILMTI